MGTLLAFSDTTMHMHMGNHSMCNMTMMMMDMDMDMKMYFHTGTHEMLLFKPWELNTDAKYAVAFIGLLLLTVFYEFLTAYKPALDAYLISNARSSASSSSGYMGIDSNAKSPSSGETIPWSIQPIRAGYHVLRLAIAYIIMLAVMTYNVGLFMAILLGAFIGFFLFNRQLYGSLPGNEQTDVAGCH